jgi:hypothetical protein
MQLNTADELFDDHSYPATTSELIATYGEAELDLTDGTQTVGDVLGLFGEETFTDAAAVRETLRTGVSHEAIGRRFYSDRDQFTPGEYGPTQVSF